MDDEERGNTVSTDVKGRVAVVGLGYVGLPLARGFCDAGFSVIGIDRSQSTIDRLRSMTSHVDDVSTEDLGRMFLQGFQPTEDFEFASEVEAIVICVPTPLGDSGAPDLKAIESVGRSLAPHLRRGTLVVLESTSHPGTTRLVLGPLLEASGLVAGRDFSLCFSSERIDPGNSHFTLENTPKVIAGLTQACRRRAAELYSTVCSTVVEASGLEEAEMSKLLENTYRQINIALANEFAMICQELGIDVWEVIRCASTKPFGFHQFLPGPGVGGHCIPIDPTFLSHHVRSELDKPFQMIELAQSINDEMPKYVARRIREVFETSKVSLANRKVLLLGITYKPNIADARATPALSLANELLAMQATVTFWDPLVPTFAVGTKAIPRETALEANLAEYDMVVLLQPHSQLDLEFVQQHSRRILDTRGVLDGPTVIRL